VTERQSPTDRGERLYDRWAAHPTVYRVVDVLSRPVRRRAVDALGLSGGETVVDLGCGPGDSIPLLCEAAGASGRVLGVDYSAGMVRRARARADPLRAASVVRADARALPVGDGTVDAALASLALSAMPGAREALEELRRGLRHGGRLAVVDARLPDGPVSRPLAALYARTVNWQGHDVLGLLRGAFAAVDVVERFDAGLGFLAVAERR
jgi:demethylmenaquinone methyltransferase/2-methoxy-6-polyprenyl-1,4-benzoquinol methylase